MTIAIVIVLVVLVIIVIVIVIVKTIMIRIIIVVLIVLRGHAEGQAHARLPGSQAPVTVQQETNYHIASSQKQPMMTHDGP